MKQRVFKGRVYHYIVSCEVSLLMLWCLDAFPGEVVRAPGGAARLLLPHLRPCCQEITRLISPPESLSETSTNQHCCTYPGLGSVALLQSSCAPDSWGCPGLDAATAPAPGEGILLCEPFHQWSFFKWQGK